MTFIVIDRGTNREWAYVALSRGREANTLYLTSPEPDDEQCTHLTHRRQRDAIEALISSLNRSSTTTAAIDHAAGSPVRRETDPLGPPPPSRDVAARVDWLLARRRVERGDLEHHPPGVELGAGR